MAQFDTGNSWSTGDTVTAQKLNNQTNNATVRAEMVTDQSENPNSAATDQFVTVNSGGTLYKVPLSSMGGVATFNASKIQDKTVASTAPAASSVLVYNNSTTQWEPTTVPTAGITDASVTTAKIADSGVTTAKIEDNAVDGTKIAMTSDAQGDLLYYDGTNYVRLVAGTSGYFLKTQGTGANPAWAEVPDKQVKSVYYTTGGTSTFPVPTGVTSVRAKAWGAGGYGNGSGNTGGCGGYCEKLFTVSAGQDISITVGAEDTGGSGNGGDTTVTYSSTTITGGGGSGSSSGVADGGTATGGDINVPGSPNEINVSVGFGISAGSGAPGAGGLNAAGQDGAVILEYVG